MSLSVSALPVYDLQYLGREIDSYVVLSLRWASFAMSSTVRYQRRGVPSTRLFTALTAGINSSLALK